MACKLIRRRMRSSDCLLKNVLATEYSGEGYKLMTELPTKFVSEHLDNFEQFSMIRILDRQSVRPYQCTLDVLKKLKESFSSDGRGPPPSVLENDRQRHQKLVKAFLDSGGVDVLLRIVMTSSLLPAHTAQLEDTTDVLETKGLCLEILCQLCIGDPSVSRSLARRDDIIHFLFVLMSRTQTTNHACEIIEHILLCRKDAFNLTTIPNLGGLVCSLDDDQLANFSRIMAVTISDLDMYDNKSSLYAQNKQKRSRCFIPVRDLNQDALMNIPTLIPRLVQVASRKPYIPRSSTNCGEVEHWMQWIDAQIEAEGQDLEGQDQEIQIHEIFDQGDQDLDGSEGTLGIHVPNMQGDGVSLQPGLQIVSTLTSRVEVVYVIGLLLIGKQRKRVQKLLAELKLIPQLSELFDEFVWRSNDSSNQNHLLGHYNGCECSPEVALKIQFLRLVHSFCDHSEYKHLMLTEPEYDELKKIQESQEVRDDPYEMELMDDSLRPLMCKGSKGMLTKIVEVMKKEPTGSTFRFWLSRAIESYLRGTTYYADQIFLIRRGLLEHVASNLIDYDIRQKEIRQSSFDLLGELVKFNVEAFKQFDKVINTEQKLEKLALIVNKSLVDSNMFIRSLMLSLQHFLKDSKQKAYALKECRLLAYILDVRQRITYLCKLLNLINVHSLTQENVSCLNTTLVFLMFANLKGEMHTYLEALKEKAESSSPTDNGNHLMQNFRELLIFWQEHYLHKDKDCSALEKSSRISFDYWKETVSTLIQDNRKSPMALLYYMTEEASERNS